MMITDGGTIIRTPVKDIPVYSRTAGGVIMMRLSDDQKLVNFTKVAREENEEADEIAFDEIINGTETVHVNDTSEKTEE
jgi:DNA gyrase subunit A